MKGSQTGAPTIAVHYLKGDQYEVTVMSASAKTIHQVNLTRVDCQKLAGPDVTPERLLEESFRFLLEREPNTSILRSFDLPSITSYFPEYESEIAKRVRGNRA